MPIGWRLPLISLKWQLLSVISLTASKCFVPMARKDTDWSELKTVAHGNKSLMVHKMYRKEERSLETPIFTSGCNCPFSWPASNTKNSLYSHFLRFGGGSSPVHSFSPRLVWAPESPSPRAAESPPAVSVPGRAKAQTFAHQQERRSRAEGSGPLPTSVSDFVHLGDTDMK